MVIGPETATVEPMFLRLRSARWASLTVVAGLVLFKALALESSPATTLPAWHLVWADEFNQPEGTSPDRSRWVFDTGGNGWGNRELQTYTDRTNNCRIENGMLVIEARREEFTGRDGVARHFTSARLKTQGRYSFTYGRIEARIQLAGGQGLWPAFWLLGDNLATVGWPACGEIDIMENIGKEPATVHGTIHGPGYSGAKGIGQPHRLRSGRFADGFHRYAVEWTPREITFLCDGEPYGTVSPTSLPTGAHWVFDAPEFIILNLAVGGAWPGDPDAATSFPQRMLVDYVRVFSGSETALNPRPRSQ